VRVDVVLVGGGLANGLIAWRLLRREPPVSLLVIERGDSLGGNHTWSFHEADLDPGQFDWVAPLVSRTWPGYDIRFPGLRRRFDGPYHAIRSSQFGARLSAALGDRVWLSSEVTAIGPSHVELSDGRRLTAAAVVDGRGLLESRFDGGVQRFVGFDATLESPHGLDRPVIMDATVPQQGGFRFCYLLPWTETELLIEDTIYADSGSIDGDASRREIERYAGEQGWRITSLGREERGALPIPFRATIPPDVGAANVGGRAGLFHPTTGYSLPHAVRIADRIARLATIDTGSIRELVDRERQARASGHRFLRRLNRMLFQAAPPEQRYRVLERFYRLPVGLIERFYADRMTPWDRLRVVVGRPPVPIGKALACWPEPG